MTRPEIIRAGRICNRSSLYEIPMTDVFLDSIDLQDQNAPSAQDHSRQPTKPSPLGTGPPAPHQAGTLREVEAEAAEENIRSPRVSKEWTNGELQQQDEDEDLAARQDGKSSGSGRQQQDNLAVAQNGGLSGSTGEDADMADGEGDDGMDDDDDMMDKISSSPSIDDGGYSLPLLWPRRLDSLTRNPISPSLSQACHENSSPFTETSDRIPLRMSPEPIAEDTVRRQTNHSDHHHTGEYLDYFEDVEPNCAEAYDEERGHEYLPFQVNQNFQDHIEDYDQYYDLDNQPEEKFVGNVEFYGNGRYDNNLTDNSEPFDDEGLMTIPYESSEDDDDDYEIPYSTDSRFVDSGWGGECLHESEDIDFEFVYALHTFVATVEGQANATKGDTMVLLDDSNSYWWLVRVVKDSSIGKFIMRCW